MQTTVRHTFPKSWKCPICTSKSSRQTGSSISPQRGKEARQGQSCPCHWLQMKNWEQATGGCGWKLGCRGSKQESAHRYPAEQLLPPLRWVFLAAWSSLVTYWVVVAGMLITVKCAAVPSCKREKGKAAKVVQIHFWGSLTGWTKKTLDWILLMQCAVVSYFKILSLHLPWKSGCKQIQE